MAKIALCMLALFVFLPCTASDHSNSKKHHKKKHDPRAHHHKVRSWCDGVIADELVIKFKSPRKSLAKARIEAEAAPEYTRKMKKLTRDRDGKSIKAKLKDVKVKNLISVFDDSEDSEEIIHNVKMQKRAKRLARIKTKLGLERVYDLKLDSDSYPNAFIDKFLLSPKKLHEAQCHNLKNIVAELSKDPSIEYVEPNYVYEIQAEINDSFYVSDHPEWNQDYDTQWALKRIGADKVWDQSMGEGVVVAVMDSGVDYNHPDLWDNIWVNPNKVPDKNRDGKVNLDDLDKNHNHKIDANEIKKKKVIGFNFSDKSNDPMDNFGHGTHVAGIIAASINDHGMVGVAPKAKILPIKVLDDKGLTNARVLARAIYFAEKVGADIANHSLGGTHESKLISDAIKATSKDVLHIAAAGNNNTNLDGSERHNFFPASYSTVIGVAATTETDRKAYFSNYGDTVDIAAPGGSDSNYIKNILSTDLTEDGYRFRVGTSMASPFVAGVAALVKAYRPNLSATKLRHILIDTAESYNSKVDIGSGIVNARNALEIE